MFYSHRAARDARDKIHVSADDNEAIHGDVDYNDYNVDDEILTDSGRIKSVVAFMIMIRIRFMKSKSSRPRNHKIMIKIIKTMLNLIQMDCSCGPGSAKGPFPDLVTVPISEEDTQGFHHHCHHHRHHHHCHHHHCHHHQRLKSSSFFLSLFTSAFSLV